MIRAAPARRIIALSAIALVAGLLAAPAIAHKTNIKPNTATWESWRGEMRDEALAAGIPAALFDEAFAGVEPIPRIIELDRRQPESTQTFDEYMARRVTAKLVAEGKAALNANRAILEEVGAKYGVQPRFIVALWGVETRYGKYTGGFSVIAALATLAYDGRRSEYFRKELMNALRILDGGHIAVADMTGSWAGAMGQSQFMPSSFMTYAVDYDGDDRRDIWSTPADIYASAANYLSRVGWIGDQTWGREVRLPEGFDPTLVDLDVAKRLSEWQGLGVRRADGGDLPSRDLAASIVLPGGEGGSAYVVYNNYRSILRWNRSHYFAMSVGRLADLIGDG